LSFLLSSFGFCFLFLPSSFCHWFHPISRRHLQTAAASAAASPAAADPTAGYLNGVFLLLHTRIPLILVLATKNGFSPSLRRLFFLSFGSSYASSRHQKTSPAILLEGCSFYLRLILCELPIPCTHRVLHISIQLILCELPIPCTFHLGHLLTRDKGVRE